jgi:hypothetical protein
VGERQPQKLRVDVDAELSWERSRPPGDLRHDLSFETQTSATLRPLYSRKSSVPCESVTTFAW